MPRILTVYEVIAEIKENLNGLNENDLSDIYEQVTGEECFYIGNGEFEAVGDEDDDECESYGWDPDDDDEDDDDALWTLDD